jgi:hypothetical protein
MTLPKTTLGLAAGVLVSAVIGWGLTGPSGLGVFLGFLLGAGLAGLSVAWQAHCMRYRPERLMRSQMEGFAVKLGAVGLFALAFRYFEPLSQSVDWRTFLLAFAAAAVIVLPLSTLDLSRLLGSTRVHAGPLEIRKTA